MGDLGQIGQSETKLADLLSNVGVKLASPPTNPHELSSLLNETKSFLAKVEQASSELVFIALHPAIKALVAENLLNQTDMDMKLTIASCLAEIIRITVPNVPNDDEIMKEVFQLFVDAIEKLNEISSPSYSKRVEILEVVARTRLYLVLLDLECESLVLEMFRHFFLTIRPCHTGNVSFWMEDIMTRVIEESDDIPSELLSCLLSNAKKDDKDVTPSSRELVKKVMNNCASKLKPYLKEVIQSTGTSLVDYDSFVASLCEGSSNALGSENLKRDVSSPEEIRNAEDLPNVVIKNLVPTINSNSVLEPDYPEQESELSPQIYQFQSAISCRPVQDISSGPTDAILEILEDHNTKSMSGRKSKSSNTVDLQENSQCASDKEALAVYTKRTGKTMEADGLQSDSPPVKQSEISTSSKSDKKTEIHSSSSLDSRNALLSSTSPVDKLPDASHPKWGQPSTFTANQDITPVADQLASYSTGTMKENIDSSDLQWKPLPCSHKKELKETTFSGKSPIKRVPSRMETNCDSVSTPLGLTSTKRSTWKESSSKQRFCEVKQQNGTAITGEDVLAGISSKVSDSLKRDLTCPDEIGNAEELQRLVTRNLVPTINSNSVLVPACPEQEPEHPPQIFQSQSTATTCRTDHGILSFPLESLADHSTKSLRGIKVKSSILVDPHKNTQIDGDKEILTVHTKRTGKTLEVDGLQSDSQSGKQAEMSTCSKPDKKTEILSSGSLDRENALVSSAATVDNLADVSHPKQGQPSVFTAKEDMTVVADKSASIGIHEETSENCQKMKELLSHFSHQSKSSEKGTGTTKENRDSSDSRRKPLPSSCQKELKKTSCNGKSPNKRHPCRMETDSDSLSTPLETTSKKRSTKKRSSSKQQNRKVITEKDMFEGTSSKLYASQLDEKELNQNLVGSRIELWWPMDDKFYPGVVDAYYPDTKTHKILYDDDDTETLMLKDERWKLINKSEAKSVKGKILGRPNVSSKRNIVVVDHESDGVSGSSNERRKAAMTQSKASVLRQESTPVTLHQKCGMSSSSQKRKGATMTQQKISEFREESTAKKLHRKRSIVECETKTKMSVPKTAEVTNNSVKCVVASEHIGLVSVEKRSSAIQKMTPGRKGNSNSPAIQNISSVPTPSEPEKAVLKRTIEHDEEIEDIRVVEAKRRLERGKRPRLNPVIAVDVSTPLTPQSSTSDDPLVGPIFNPTFKERIRVFSLICRNKWYERNLTPLPDFAEFADEFGRDAAFDYGNLFKTITQTPHYQGLDASKSEQFLDLWYILPQLFEALNRSFSSQNFLERNKETIKDWFTKLTQAGFDISVPLAAFELLVIWPTDFMNFLESLDSVSRQLSEDRPNVEGLKSKLPVSERIAGLVLKIEDLQQQIRNLESERMSLWPLKSVELELEKYGTSMKAYRLKKQKELYEKELEVVEQFLQDVSLGGWYEQIRLASQPK